MVTVWSSGLRSRTTPLAANTRALDSFVPADSADFAFGASNRPKPKRAINRPRDHILFSTPLIPPGLTAGIADLGFRRKGITDSAADRPGRMPGFPKGRYRRTTSDCPWPDWC